MLYQSTDKHLPRLLNTVDVIGASMGLHKSSLDTISRKADTHKNGASEVALWTRGSAVLT